MLTRRQMLAATAGAIAQPTSAPTGTLLRGRLAATADQLVVGLSDSERSLILKRTRTTPFGEPALLGAPLHLIATSPRGVFVFMADGTFYRLEGEEFERELDLPNRAAPRAVTAAGADLLALIPARAAVGLPLESTSIPAAQRDANAAGPDQLALARYSGRQWSLLAVLPPIPNSTEPPRVSAGPDGDVSVTWLVAPDQLLTLRFDGRTGWQPGPTLGLPGLQQFWRTRLSGVPTLVFIGDGPRDELRLLRELPARQPPAATTPRIERVELSALPADVQAAEIVDVAAFNDHLVTLTRTTDDKMLLQFGRLAGPALLPTVDVEELQRSAAVTESTEAFAGTTAFLLMVAVLLGLFVFRRQALGAPHGLPAPLEPAFAAQRLGTVLVDLTPFALIWAGVLGVDWMEGGGKLAEWAFRRALPERDVLLWWATTVTTYSVYALIMEALARRTVGKALFGTRVVGPGGTAPTLGALFVRNLMRIVELLPPMWIINLLVIISRNRQRLGDVFAGTFAVRLVRRSPEDEAAE